MVTVSPRIGEYSTTLLPALSLAFTTLWVAPWEIPFIPFGGSFILYRLSNMASSALMSLPFGELYRPPTSPSLTQCQAFGQYQIHKSPPKYTHTVHTTTAWMRMTPNQNRMFSIRRDGLPLTYLRALSESSFINTSL